MTVQRLPNESVSALQLGTSFIQNFDSPMQLNQNETLDQKSIEKLMAKDISQLSSKELGVAYEDIHGVSEVVEETPQMVIEKLQQMEHALRVINHKPAYDQAETMNYQYVNDPKFRLMFLRADCFDPQKAAARLVNFMEGKLKYFGPICLARPIFLSDLDEDDLQTLKAGPLQILPVRDRAGRAIFSDSMTMSPRFYKNSINVVSLFENCTLTFCVYDVLTSIIF